MSGAAELVAQIIEAGDDSDFAHIYVASPAFCDALTAQLFASGRPLYILLTHIPMRRRYHSCPILADDI